MKIKLLSLVSLGIVGMISLNSCSRCKDCQQTTSTYQAVGTTDSLVTEQNVDMGEVCGEELTDKYRREYNEIRPHEALNNTPPTKYKLNAIL